jgi:squalene-hopene/tetraprenyl-beta-curcumene cyclase
VYNSTTGRLRNRITGLALVAVAIFAAAAASWFAFTAKASRWNPDRAARYLDRREAAWSTWPGAARDQKTFCVSCHTALPYALARPALRVSTDQTDAPPSAETALLADVTKRVRKWSEIQPYYPGMDDQSRGTEAVLNALILASHDAPNGRMSSDSLAAFGHMWETQETTGTDQGAWPWIQLGNEPWEAPNSVFYGACLAAVAVGVAPENYRADPGIQRNLDSLRNYFDRKTATQPAMNRAALLWASANLPGLVTAAEQKSLVNEMIAAQRPDGGWSLSSLAGGWQRDDGTPLVYHSDGYATGLIVLSLEELGFPTTEAHVAKGRSWLASNQAWWTGGWDGYSLNHRRHDPFSMVSQFMNDAATAYAVLALTEAPRPSPAGSDSARLNSGTVDARSH